MAYAQQHILLVAVKQAQAELLAGVRAVLRRAGKLPAARVVCGALEIDSEKHRVSVAGRNVPLTPTEYALLAELAGNVDRVLTTRLLLRRVWGPQYSDATDYVKVVVRRLRAILEPAPVLEWSPHTAPAPQSAPSGQGDGLIYLSSTSFARARRSVLSGKVSLRWWTSRH